MVDHQARTWDIRYAASTKACKGRNQLNYYNIQIEFCITQLSSVSLQFILIPFIALFPNIIWKIQFRHMQQS